MADRYWVGGTGSWSATNTANWSTGSGGSGGASVPTASDNVFFDANSNVGTGAFTVTVSGTGSRTCADLTFSGLDGTCTFTGTTGLAVSGSLALTNTNLTYSYTGSITLNGTGTHTINTGARNMNHSVTIASNGGTYTLAANYAGTNANANFFVTQGTFDTANYNVTVDLFSSTGTSTRSIQLGSSTLSLNVAAGPQFVLSGSNLTFTAGTSQITVGQSSAVFDPGGYTLYNVTFQPTGSTAADITSGFTCNNLTITDASVSGTVVHTEISIYGSTTITVNGTLTITGTSRRKRVNFIESRLSGTALPIVSAAAVSLTDVNFRGIVAQGVAAPFTGTRLGNGGNSCSGITFEAERTVYWRGVTGTSASNATTSPFSLTSGAAVSTDAYPLPQDTVVVNGDTLATTVEAAEYFWCKSLDFTNRSTAITYTVTGTVIRFGGTNGSLKLSSSVTCGTASNTSAICSTDSFEITSAGVTLRGVYRVQQFNGGGSPTPTTKLLQNTTLGVNSSVNSLNIDQGRFDCNGYTFTCFNVNIGDSNSSRRSELYLNGGAFEINPRTTDVTLLTCTTATNYYQQPNTWIDFVGDGAARTFTLNMQAAATSYTANGINGMPSIRKKSTSVVTRFALGGKYMGNLDFSESAQSPGYTFDLDACDFYGTMKFSTDVTHDSSTSRVAFVGNDGIEYDIDFGASTPNLPITVDKTSGSVRLLRDLTIGSTRTFTLNSGGFNLNGKTLTHNTSTTMDFASTNTRTLTMGVGGVITTNSSIVDFGGTGFTCTDPQNGKIVMTRTASQADFYAPITSECPTIEVAAAQGIYLNGPSSGTGYVYDLKNSVQPTKVTFYSGRTVQFSNFSLRGTSGNLVTIDRYLTAGNGNINKTSGIVDCDFLSITRSSAAGGATWYAGANSTDAGNNTGWLFQAAIRTLTGNNVAQGAISGTGAVEQIASGINLTGNNVSQAATSGTGAVSVVQTIVGNSVFQSALSGTGSITQAQTITGNSAVQSAISGTGAASQIQDLSGNNVAQFAFSGTGSVSVIKTMTANNVSQSAISGTGSISLVYNLSGAAVLQTANSGSGSVTQAQILTGASSQQSSQSSVGAIIIGTILSGNSVTQQSTSGTGAIEQIIITTAPAGSGYPPKDLTGYQWERPEQTDYQRPVQSQMKRPTQTVRKRT